MRRPIRDRPWGAAAVLRQLDRLRRGMCLRDSAYWRSLAWPPPCGVTPCRTCTSVPWISSCPTCGGSRSPAPFFSSITRTSRRATRSGGKDCTHWLGSRVGGRGRRIGSAPDRGRLVLGALASNYDRDQV